MGNPRWKLTHNNKKSMNREMEPITMKKSLELALNLSGSRFGSFAGVEQQDNFDDIDYDEAEDPEIVKRTHRLPDLIDIVHTGPHWYFC